MASDQSIEIEMTRLQLEDLLAKSYKDRRGGSRKSFVFRKPTRNKEADSDVIFYDIKECDDEKQSNKLLLRDLSPQSVRYPSRKRNDFNAGVIATAIPDNESNQYAESDQVSDDDTCDVQTIFEECFSPPIAMKAMGVQIHSFQTSPNEKEKPANCTETRDENEDFYDVLDNKEYPNPGIYSCGDNEKVSNINLAQNHMRNFSHEETIHDSRNKIRQDHSLCHTKFQSKRPNIIPFVKRAYANHNHHREKDNGYSYLSGFCEKQAPIMTVNFVLDKDDSAEVKSSASDANVRRIAHKVDNRENGRKNFEELKNRYNTRKEENSEKTTQTSLESVSKRNSVSEKTFQVINVQSKNENERQSFDKSKPNHDKTERETKTLMERKINRKSDKTFQAEDMLGDLKKEHMKSISYHQREDRSEQGTQTYSVSNKNAQESDVLGESEKERLLKMSCCQRDDKGEQTEKESSTDVTSKTSNIATSQCHTQTEDTDASETSNTSTKPTSIKSSNTDDETSDESKTRDTASESKSAVSSQDKRTQINTKTFFQSKITRESKDLISSFEKVRANVTHNKASNISEGTGKEYYLNNIRKSEERNPTTYDGTKELNRFSDFCRFSKYEHVNNVQGKFNRKGEKGSYSEELRKITAAVKLRTDSYEKLIENLKERNSLKAIQANKHAENRNSPIRPMFNKDIPTSNKTKSNYYENRFDKLNKRFCVSDATANNSKKPAVRASLHGETFVAPFHRASVRNTITNSDVSTVDQVRNEQGNNVSVGSSRQTRDVVTKRKEYFIGGKVVRETESTGAQSISSSDTLASLYGRKAWSPPKPPSDTRELTESLDAILQARQQYSQGEA